MEREGQDSRRTAAGDGWVVTKRWSGYGDKEGRIGGEDVVHSIKKGSNINTRKKGTCFYHREMESEKKKQEKGRGKPCQPPHPQYIHIQ